MLVDFLSSITRVLIDKWLSALSSRDRLRVLAFGGHEVNADGVGTFLCLHIKIINPGSTSIYFERLEAVDKNGETYFPLFYGVKTAVEVPPKRNIVGTVPCGHVTSVMPIELRVYDSTERCHVLKRRKFRKTMSTLADQRRRLELLGFNVHPNESQKSLQ